jgi:hypothetical protein
MISAVISTSTASTPSPFFLTPRKQPFNALTPLFISIPKTSSSTRRLSHLQNLPASPNLHNELRRNRLHRHFALHRLGHRQLHPLHLLMIPTPTSKSYFVRLRRSVAVSTNSPNYRRRTAGSSNIFMPQPPLVPPTTPPKLLSLHQLLPTMHKLASF